MTSAEDVQALNSIWATPNLPLPASIAVGLLAAAACGRPVRRVLLASLLARGGGLHGRRRVRAALKELVQTGALIRPLFTGAGWQHRLSLCLSVGAVGFVASGIEVLISYANRDIMQAMADRDARQLWWMVLTTVAYLVVGSISWVGFEFLQARLILEWRAQLMSHLVTEYTGSLRFYHLALGISFAAPSGGAFPLGGASSQRGVEATESEIVDNPDQRIAEDAGEFCRLSIRFSLKLMRYSIKGTAFVMVLWRISPRLAVCAVAYSALGTIGVYKVFGRRLLELNNSLLLRGADLRFALIRMREHAETIALLGGGSMEGERLRERIGDFTCIDMLVRWCEACMSFCRTLLGGIPRILPVALLAPAYFSQQLQLSDLTQSAEAFEKVQENFSIVVNYFDELSKYRAVAARLHALDAVLDQPMAECCTKSGAALPGLPGPTQLQTPGGQTVARIDGLLLEPSHAVAVEGPSGCGKSTLLRTLAGVWPFWQGEVTSAMEGAVLCLPQEAYLLHLAPLKAQVTYPLRLDCFTDEAVAMALQRAQLGGLARRFPLHEAADLASALSGGERQRVGWARLFLHLEGRPAGNGSTQLPHCLLLDEPTAALDIETATAVFEALEAVRQQRPIAVLTISHSPALRRFHPHTIAFEQAPADSTWYQARSRASDAS